MDGWNRDTTYYRALDARTVHGRWRMGCREMGRRKARAVGRRERDSCLQGASTDGRIEKLHAICATNRRSKTGIIYCCFIVGRQEPYSKEQYNEYFENKRIERTDRRQLPSTLRFAYQNLGNRPNPFFGLLLSKIDFTVIHSKLFGVLFFNCWFFVNVLLSYIVDFISLVGDIMHAPTFKVPKLWIFTSRITKRQNCALSYIAILNRLSRRSENQ